MPLEVEFGNGDVNNRIKKRGLQVEGIFADACRKFFAPLTGDVVRDQHERNESADDAREEDIIHINIPYMNSVHSKANKKKTISRVYLSPF